MNPLPPFPLFEQLRRSGFQRGWALGGLLLVALFAFEIFNYSTTDFALTDLLGANLKFMGIRWATILSIAFCAIDFAGIARIFTPEQGESEPVEVWYLFGAWVLAAAINATLTWWGVSVATHSHTALGSAILGRETLVKIVPVFVAVMVWTIRILLIGTFSVAGERIFTQAKTQPTRAPYSRLAQPSTQAARPALKTTSAPTRPEPTYHPAAGMAAKPKNEQPPRWK